MDNNSHKWVVVLIGPPGSGKDTQAEMLSQELGLLHVQTSKILEDIFAKSQSDPFIAEQKHKFDTGELVDRNFVTSLIIDEIKKNHGQSQGMVFSGSPRDLEEAKKEAEVLGELYGKENIKVITIIVSEDESVKRNSNRRVCLTNRHPIPDIPEYANITACPQDGSPLIKRGLDELADLIHKRYGVFKERSQPILDFFKQNGYNIIEINGEQSIEDVHRDILNKLW